MVIHKAYILLNSHKIDDEEFFRIFQVILELTKDRTRSPNRNGLGISCKNFTENGLKVKKMTEDEEM
jgi:hypothetical protein